MVWICFHICQTLFSLIILIKHFFFLRLCSLWSFSSPLCSLPAVSCSRLCSDFWLKHKMRPALVCRRMFAHFLLEHTRLHRGTQGALCFPVATGFYSWRLPLCIRDAQSFQDTPAGRLMVSQMLRSRSAAALDCCPVGLWHWITAAVKTPD